MSSIFANVDFSREGGLPVYKWHSSDLLPPRFYILWTASITVSNEFRQQFRDSSFWAVATLPKFGRLSILYPMLNIRRSNTKKCIIVFRHPIMYRHDSFRAEYVFFWRGVTALKLDLHIQPWKNKLPVEMSR